MPLLMFYVKCCQVSSWSLLCLYVVGYGLNIYMFLYVDNISTCIRLVVLVKHYMTILVFNILKIGGFANSFKK